ncbi:MAG: monofunctional biosynthetic peptidoglycan transglycosylase [Desulfobacterales bacterium]
MLLGLILVSVLQVAVLRFINPPFTLAMAWDYVKSVVTLSPYPRTQWIWRPLAQISPRLQRAVLAAEDQRFARHHGFDLVEIQATVKDMVNEGRLRGASTISMQTARTLFLLPARNLVRKALEAYYTVLLELFWNKRRILEIYLNTVDWGNGVMGAEAAAQTYFNRSAQQLSARQAALLAAVLPNPHRFSPTRPTAYMNQRARRILADMHKMPIF